MGKLNVISVMLLNPMLYTTIKPDTTGLGLVLKAQVEFQSEAHKFYKFNYSLTYNNIFVSTCISPTLLNKNNRKGQISKNFLCYFNRSVTATAHLEESKNFY